MSAATGTAPVVTVRPGSVNSGITADRVVRIYQRNAFGRTTYELWCGRSDSGKRASTLDAAQVKATEYQSRIR